MISILRLACDVGVHSFTRDHACMPGRMGKVSMCNYRANRLVCEAADRAIQVHGGIGYSRHMPFEHIYRHHRRYRITEGSEEIQIRKVAAHLFGFIDPSRKGKKKKA